MRKKDTSHPYKDPLSFERLMLLIATLLKYPGIGCPDVMEALPKNQHHNALTQVQLGLRELANVLGIQLPANYPSTPTLRKDLETLRHYGILDRRMYRWGYYLGTGVMSQEELKVAIDAIASQAKYQGDSQVRRIHETLSKRLRGLDLQLNGEFFYPIRQYLNRAIVHTDPEEMAEKGNNQDTLFHKLPILEQAIIQGQPVEISRSQDLYGTPNQEIISSPIDEITGKINFVDYIIALPPRSLNEFLFWVYRYMDKAQVLAPPSLVQKHHDAAKNLVTRF